MQSQFDSATQCAINLTPGWISTMGEDYKEEDDPDWPLILLKNESRRAIFNLCAILGVCSYGVPGLACRLTERYISEEMRSTVSLSGTQSWQEYTTSMRIKMPLLMTTCIQLAAKMKCNKLNVKTVQTCLLDRGLRCSLCEIKEAEFNVYKTLRFRIPLWTSVEQAQATAVHIGLPRDLMCGVELMTSVVESLRDDLDCRIRVIAKKCVTCKKLGSSIIRTVHLVAGCVIATATYMEYPGQVPLQKLADLVQAPVCYLDHISRTVIATLTEDVTTAITADSNQETQTD